MDSPLDFDMWPAGFDPQETVPDRPETATNHSQSCARERRAKGCSAQSELPELRRQHHSKAIRVSPASPAVTLHWFRSWKPSRSTLHRWFRIRLARELWPLGRQPGDNVRDFLC